MKIEDWVGGRQVKASEKMEAGFHGRPTKRIERMESKGRQARENEKLEDGEERRQAREGGWRWSRQSRLAWKGYGE